MSKVYYTDGSTPTENDRLLPAPSISISLETKYSNDVIIDYSYIININGFIVNKDNQSTLRLVEKIDKLRSLLSSNGRTLYIYHVDEQNNETLVLKAKGGILRSLSFDKSDNSWTITAPYTASIEFNELEFFNENIACSTGDFANQTYSAEHKIKSYSDSWSFSIAEEAFNYHDEYHNMIINASYSISAQGKNYYNESGQLMPAHEQARLFAQKIIYDRVSALGAKDLFGISGEGPCGNKFLNQVHEPVSSGILYGLGRSFAESSFDKYNESLTFEISESQGTFSASYTCLLKSNAFNKNFSQNNVTHIVRKNIQKTNDSTDKQSLNMSVEGTIQGLIRDGIFEPNFEGMFVFNRTGSYVVSPTAPSSKYNNANSFYFDKIGTSNDLLEDFKEYLGIGFTQLGVSTSECSETPENPTKNTDILPSSFNLTHNYNEGTITYNASYNSENACEQNKNTGQTTNVTNISITREGSTPVLAEIVIPNAGLIVQDIGTKTATKITININGTNSNNQDTTDRECCKDSDTLDNIFESLFSGCISNTDIELPSGVAIPENAIILSKQQSKNLIEGTYTTNITYMCDPGCI